MEYKITIKAPVYIGSGEKLSSIDSMPLGDKYAVIDVAKVLEEVKDNLKALDEFGRYNFRIKDFLRDYKISPNEVIKYTLNNPQHLQPWNISEMIKTGFGKLLIPGTSLKGALRTVIFWHLFKDSPTRKIENILNDILKKADPRRRSNADDPLEHYLFGKDPNHDLLRGLQVGDAEFEILNLQLINVKVLTLDNRRGFLWKKMRRQGFNTPDPSKATSIYCEALSIDATSTVNINADKYLLEDKIASTQLGFSDKKRYLLDLPKYCNEFANDFISQEIEFFEKCKIGEILDFYKALQKEISQDDNSFLLHLGWGSGWRGMTGNCINASFLRQFRVKYRLGKSQYPIFPKTRKLIFESNQPKYPLGWIKLEVI